MATAMLLWTYTHKLPLYSAGVIYLHEGDEDEMGREYADKTLGDGVRLKINKLSSHSTTLTFSSIIVFLIGNSVYPMMGMIAYGIAADWMQLQDRVANSSEVDYGVELPSPLQYVLLTRLCSSNSFSSIIQTLQHWHEIRSFNRSGLPKLLKKALVWLIVLLSLQTSTAWLDFLMHETTRTVSVVDVDEKTSLLPYSMRLNTTLCPSERADAYPCLLLPLESTGGNTSSAALFANEDQLVSSEGWLVANKASREYSVQIHKDADNSELDNMSYYTNPNVRTQDYMEEGYTIGLKARCSMLTSSCQSTDRTFDCSNAGRPELKSSLIVAQSNLTPATEYVTISDVLYSTDINRNVQYGQDAFVGPQSNPWTVSGLVVSPTSTSVPHSGFQDFQIGTEASLHQQKTHFSYGAFECDLTFRDVKFSYFNETYEIEAWNDSHVSLAHNLSGPLLAGLVSDIAFSAIAPVAGRVEVDAFTHALEQSLSFNLLALSAGLIQRDLVPVHAWRPILAQQYDKSVLYSYIALLYAYAVTAVVLFSCAWGTSSSCIVFREEDGLSKEVAAVTIAQRWLMEPVGYLTALSIGSKCRNRSDSHEKQRQNHTRMSRPPTPSRTARCGLLQIFPKHAHEERVVVGLERGGAGFGVWPISRLSTAESFTTGDRDNITFQGRPYPE
ncbi:hypothetical protein CBS101457_003769 [Exobasidium rhododendri]|nr:hypothetical protein CBS101457_003769 [Exobasidium rhododendri]